MISLGGVSLPSDPATPDRTRNDGAMIGSEAYTWVSGCATFQLDSSNKKVATRLLARVAFALPSLSVYCGASATSGDMPLQICYDSVAQEPDGTKNDSTTQAHANMTATDAPSPLVAYGTTNASIAYRAFDGTNATIWESTTDPSVTPQNLGIDFGVGTICNKARIQNYTVNGYEPQSWTIHGSTLAAPDYDDDGDWSSALYTAATVADPGPNNYYEMSWTNSTAYRHYKAKFTLGTGGQVRVARLIFIEAKDEPAPGAEITDLSTLTMDSVAWKRTTWAAGSQHQFAPRDCVWLVGTGVDTKDFSVGYCRVNTGQGSMFPYGMLESKTSSDGGTTYTALEQNSKPALWLTILASASGHVPQVIYGRKTGDTVDINGSPIPIPVGGVFGDCSALSEVTPTNGVTPYDVFLYLNSGALALEFDNSTGKTYTNGQWHMTGQEGYRWIGMVAPQQLQAGVYGPVENPSSMGVFDAQRKSAIFFRANPNTGAANQSVELGKIEQWADDSTWEIWILSHGGVATVNAIPGGFNGSTSALVAVALDNLTNVVSGISTLDVGTVHPGIRIPPGFHRIMPVFINDHGSSALTCITYVYSSGSLHGVAHVSGQIVFD